MSRKRGACLDHAREPASIEDRPDRVELSPQKLRVLVGIEGAGVERDRHALVALLGQQLDGVGEAMMSQAVCVVSEQHDVPAIRLARLTHGLCTWLRSQFILTRSVSEGRLHGPAPDAELIPSFTLRVSIGHAQRIGKLL